MNKTIIDIANEYVTQDNRCTAFPYALLVIEEELVQSEDGDVIGIYSPYQAVMFYYSETKDPTLLEEALNYADGELHEELREDFNNIYWADDMLNFYREYIDEDARLYQYNKQYVHKGEQMFLTESSAEAHIKLNGHNMKNPITYGIHIFRNPDMELLIQDLMTKATVPMEQWNHEAQHYYKRVIQKEK